MLDLVILAIVAGNLWFPSGNWLFYLQIPFRNMNNSTLAIFQPCQWILYPIQASSVPCARVFSLGTGDNGTSEQDVSQANLMEAVQMLQYSIKKGMAHWTFTPGYALGQKNLQNVELCSQDRACGWCWRIWVAAWGEPEMDPDVIDEDLEDPADRSGTHWNSNS